MHFNFQGGNWKTLRLFRLPVSVERMENILRMEWNAIHLMEMKTRNLVVLSPSHCVVTFLYVLDLVFFHFQIELVFHHFVQHGI